MELSYAHFDGPRDMDSALYYARKVENASSVNKLPVHHAAALNQIGRCYKELNQDSLAIYYYELSAGEFLRTTNPEYAQTPLLNLYYNHRDNGRLEEAEQALYRRMELFHKLGDSISAFKNYYNLARIQYQRGDMDSSLALARLALGQLRELEDSSGIAEGLDHLSHVFYMSAQYDSVLVYAPKVIQYAKPLNRYSNLPDNYNRLCYSLIITGNYNQAEEVFKEGRDLMGARKDIRGFLSLLGDRAYAYYARNEDVRALVLALEVHDTVEQVGSTWNKMVNNTFIGTLYEEKLKDYDKALVFISKARKAAEELNDEKWTLINMLNEGGLKAYTGDLAGAEKLLLEAEARAESQSSVVLVSLAHLILAEFYQLQGDETKALTYLQKGVDLESMGRFDFKAYVPRFLAQMGKTYFRNGYVEQAIDYCVRGLEMAKDNEHYEYQRRNCECLYEVYTGLGDDQKSLLYLRKLKIVEDTVNAR